MGALHQPSYQYIGMNMNCNVSPVLLQYLQYKFTHVAMAPAFKLLWYQYGTTASHMHPTDEKSCVQRRKLFMYLCHSLYSNHHQFTVVCNTPASTHTHTHSQMSQLSLYTD